MLSEYSWVNKCVSTPSIVIHTVISMENNVKIRPKVCHVHGLEALHKRVATMQHALQMLHCATLKVFGHIQMHTIVLLKTYHAFSTVPRQQKKNDPSANAADRSLAREGDRCVQRWGEDGWHLGLQRQVVVGSSQTLNLPSNEAGHIDHEASRGGAHGVRLGIQSTQHTHSVAIGQHDGGATIAADVRRLCYHMEVSEPALFHDRLYAATVMSDGGVLFVPRASAVCCSSLYKELLLCVVVAVTLAAQMLDFCVGWCCSFFCVHVIA